MILIVSKRVVDVIDEFYLAAMALHESLDAETVHKKKQRLIDSLNFLTMFPEAYGCARVKKEWREYGYREFLCEDFHFAYTISRNEKGDKVIRVVDAVHSLLNHD